MPAYAIVQAQAWWASPEYAAAKALRQATADSMMIVAEGIPSATTD
jgi:uncharacterized protein (DUF1330 family)